MTATAVLGSSDAIPAPSGGLVDRVMKTVQHRIRSEALAPGDALPSENALATEIGVSRAVVREALHSMAALRIIDIGNGRRARVSAMDASVLGLVLDHAIYTDQISIQQIMDFRRTIEMRAVGLAALRRSDREAEEIVGHAGGMRSSMDEPDAVMAHDIAFHETIARASRNPMFALIVGSFRVVMRQTWPIGWRARTTEAEQSDNIGCHEAIAHAVAKRDPRAAEQHMAEHFDNTVKVLLTAGVI